MFSIISISSQRFLRRLALCVSFGLLSAGSCIFLQAEEEIQEDIIAYATPKNPYTFVYALDKVHTTTLFRSEKFEKLDETTEGYIVSLKLGGKQQFVLLPFEMGDRKVAEEKFMGVGVNYTAYLTFAQSYLPFKRESYYEVLEVTEDTLRIDYKFKGFRKIIEVPADNFNLKTSFQYHLDAALELVRVDYPTYDIVPEKPEDWDKAGKVKPRVSPFQSTHLGVVENADIGINLESGRQVSPKDVRSPLKSLVVNDETLYIFPIAFTWEVESVSYHFIRLNDEDRPALIKEFNVPEGEEGYHKFIEMELKSGETARLLEVTGNVSIEIIEDTTFFIPGTLVAVAKVQNDLPVHTKQGVYRGYNNAFKLYTPKEFLNTWTQRTEKKTLTPNNALFKKFLDFPFPPVLISENSEWADLREIQKMATHYSAFIEANRDTDFKSMIKYLEALDKIARSSHITLNSKPDNSRHPHLIRNYHSYWKQCAYRIFALAALKKEFSVIKLQLLKFTVLQQEIKNPNIADFIAEQIYTYESYMPIALNKVSKLEIDTHIAKTDIMIWGQSIDELLTIDTTDGLALQLDFPSIHKDENLLLKPKFNHTFSLSTERSLPWFSETSEYATLVRTQQYWVNKQAQEEENILKLKEARNDAKELQESIEQDRLAASIPDSTWVAIAAWLILLFVVNCAFLVLLRGFPTSSPTPQNS